MNASPNLQSSRSARWRVIAGYWEGCRFGRQCVKTVHDLPPAPHKSIYRPLANPRGTECHWISSRMKPALVSVLLPFMALSVTRAQAPKLSDAPKPIRELSASIQGKRPDDVRTAIIERLGPPQRDIGSGYRIEQWDTSGGVLTFHPVTGPTFSDPKTKTYFRLIRTSNPAAGNLLDSYEMTTLPDPANTELDSGSATSNSAQTRLSNSPTVDSTPSNAPHRRKTSSYFVPPEPSRCATLRRLRLTHFLSQ
jgi:hypothetical protein